MTAQNTLPLLPLKKPSLWQRIKNSDKLYLLVCFLLPLLINWFIFIIRGVYPFGEKSVLVLDLNGQYVYYFEAMRDILQGDASPFYTWYRALGGEFSGIYAYYVASPFALLSVFFPEDGITEFLLTMTLLKVGSMGLSFGYYLHSSRPSKPFTVVMFSTMYALTSYAVVQANNTMWIDSLIYLPLIALGIEKICHSGKFTLYTVTLALCFISNFYIGFMTAIFSTLYFFYYYISKYPLKDFTRFFFAFYKWLLCSIAAAMIASIIIIPAYFSLQFGKNTFSNPSYEFKSKFDYINVFTQMLPNSYDTVRPEGLPFIYCGVLSLIMLPVYFVTKKIKGREKIMSGIILALMVFSFTASTVDLFWHGMQRPNWLNYRYSFMFCLLVLVFAYEAFRFLDGTMFRTVLSCAAVIGLCVVFVQTMDFEFIDDIFCIWFTIIMLGVLVALIWGYCKKNYKGASAVLLSVVCLELFLNGIYDSLALHEDVYYSTRTSYVEFMARWSPLVEKVQSEDISLYRMEKTVHRKVNDNMTLQMRGITNSTSTLNASVIRLLNKMGYASKSHWSRYAGGNPVSDSLLGIKYVLSNKDDLCEQYELMYDYPDETSEKGDMLYAYENPYCLPILFGVNESLTEYELEDETPAPEVLNDIISAMLGHTVEIFKPIEDVSVTTDGLREASASGHKKYALLEEDSSGYVQYEFTTEYSGDIYIHFPSKYPREVTLSVAEGENGRTGSFVSKGNYMGNETHTIKNIGTYESGKTVNVRLKLKDKDLYFYKNQNYFFYFDSQAFAEAIEELRESKIFIEDFSDTSIKGNINIAEGDELVYTSIPYDKGWTVKVDGKKVKLEKSLDSLLCFHVSQGEHTIEMNYVPQGFAVGCVLCIIGISAVAVLTVLDYKKRKKRREKLLATVRSDGSGFVTSLQNLLAAAEIDAEVETEAEVDEITPDETSSDETSSDGTSSDEITPAEEIDTEQNGQTEQNDE